MAQRKDRCDDGTRSMKAVLYARVSSKDQEKEGYSIPAQQKLLREYARENGFAIIDEYIDVETAKAAGRTNFNVMLRYLKDQKKLKPESACTTILVEKTDRLYRNLKDYVTLDELGLNVHLVKENSILGPESKCDQKFMHGIQVLMAKRYIDNLSEETKKGMREKAEQGLYPQMAPFGYKNVERDSRRCIVPDEQTRQAVVQLYELYATGRYSLKDLTRIMNIEVLPQLSRKSRFTRASVHEWLRNPFYYGDFMWRDQYYEGKHEPIISRELFEKVQSVLDNKGSGGAHFMKHSWLLQGLVQCGHCGCAMTAELKKGKYIYYHCTKNRGDCPAVGYVREKDLDAALHETLIHVHLPEDVLAFAKTALRESFRAEKNDHHEAIDKLNSKHTQLQQRLERLYEDKLDGTIDQDLYSKKKQEYRLEQSHIEELLAKHRNADRSYLDHGETLIDLMSRAYQVYQTGSPEQKRLILQTVHSNRLWRDGQVVVTYRQPFSYLVSLKSAYTEAGAEEVEMKKVLPRTDSNHQPTG